MFTKHLVVIFIFLFFLSGFITDVSATSPLDYTKNSGSQCTTATMTLFITGGPGEQYNISNLNAPVDTCVAIVFHNADTIAHTFTIDSSSSTANSTPFNIFLNAGKTGSANYMTPKTNMDLKFYCAVPGHEAAGMYGTLIIGTGQNTSSTSSNSNSITPTTSKSVAEIKTTTPSFEIESFFIAIMLATLFSMKLKRLNK